MGLSWGISWYVALCDECLESFVGSLLRRWDGALDVRYSEPQRSCFRLESCSATQGVVSPARADQTYAKWHTVEGRWGLFYCRKADRLLLCCLCVAAYLTSEYAASLLMSASAGGVMAIRSSPSSPTHVICQLRNDWIVVLDFLAGVMLKLHTFLKGECAR